ncbi:MAG: hypothetical protein HC882_01385 [Acidobacteria bacterium]|nr:hypothetical protein [Acidobacteriota bacterium]
MKRRKTKRPPRRTMASNSFREVEIEAVLALFAKAELAPETKELCRSPYVQTTKVKFVKMRERLRQTQARTAFVRALEEASLQDRVVVEPARPAARRGRP